MSESGREFRARYGPWALVAGASAGLGAAFARELAQAGLNIVIVARREGLLRQLEGELVREFGVRVRGVPLDLAGPECWKRLWHETRDLEIGLLVYNAALSEVGPFLEQDLETALRTLDVNCRAPLALARLYGAEMRTRGRGGILLMSSLAGAQGSPLLANYAATKAYNTVLAEGLWDELGAHGIDVLAACAGATRTPTFEASKPQNLRPLRPPLMEPEPVAREALAALGRGPTMVPGRINRLAALLLRWLMPRRAAIRLMGRQTRAMYGPKGAAPHRRRAPAAGERRPG